MDIGNRAKDYSHLRPWMEGDDLVSHVLIKFEINYFILLN